ncbi:hypothetical protein BM1_07533 [Bipolaris maydis]|nr:hypothetical protein BM1_07533 [Bipolaris maydis]
MQANVHLLLRSDRVLASNVADADVDVSMMQGATRPSLSRREQYAGTERKRPSIAGQVVLVLVPETCLSCLHHAGTDTASTDETPPKMRPPWCDSPRSQHRG